MAVVSIVGRPNVGKSSLFNRIAGRRISIVDDLPGVTRDRIYAEVEIEGHSWYIVDTGGILPGSKEGLEEHITLQVRAAVEESDVILFMIDGREGPTPLDHEIAQILRESMHPVLVVPNKIDDVVHEDLAMAAYELGFREVVPVSAEHGRNLDELYEKVTRLLPPEPAPELAETVIPVAIVGRPNVGKSSMLNRFAGSDRVLVDEVPGTTRDTVDIMMERDGVSYRFMDTAGLRKRSRVRSRIEYYSTLRSYEAIDRSGVAILLMDGAESGTEQEKRLAGHVLEKGRGLILAVNKWDLAPREPGVGDRMTRYIRQAFPFVSHAPLVFLSAKTGRGMETIPAMITEVWENWRRRIATGPLNRLLQDLMAFERLPSNGAGRFLRIYYASQVRGAPPTFVFFVNDPEIVTRAFHRHVERQLRRLARFDGAPLRLFWRKSGG